MFRILHVQCLLNLRNSLIYSLMIHFKITLSVIPSKICEVDESVGCPANYLRNISVPISTKMGTVLEYSSSITHTGILV